ncbi:lysine-sensitive aspartokinase 3 [Aliiglaciecola sp. LCG003]|uniref:lysine-sensitive aspartokinase 3 n=1 Tax=Aliiglaciecola sp. LCG003 TaxID=3053655 RepID=UPI002572EAF3|nr:lysine-sensitive aspartokinase 3 [Aliiglaciecola sp. LCG003]WJG10181.1 lysine-sensitive aspartokinase 3 [Aliiglaciecola sp. LCG003]
MTVSSLNIAKFGGTSVATMSAMRNCAKIVAAEPATRVVVVSASAGVTNHLVSLANTPLTQAQIIDIIEKIKAIQYSILQDLGKPPELSEKLESLLEALIDAAQHEELLHRDDLKDTLLSFGERMSSLLFTEVLKREGVNAENFDVRKVLRTDTTFGEAVPQLAEIERLASQLMQPEIIDKVLVTQGFVGADEIGRTTTLGRGGSDFTAALLAEALGAQSCEIWTDVVGVYTTDPRITDTARPLPELSFEEAAEMANFGAKVLHPATMEPALRQDIKVFVGSSKEPEKGGTWIVRNCKHEPPYRAITRRKEQVMVTVKTPKMMHAPGFLQQVFTIIAKHNLSVDLVTTSEIAVSFTLDNPANSVAEKLNRETLDELRDFCEVVIENNYDLVTVVGNNMHSAAGVSSKIFWSVRDYNLRMICYGANPHNMSFLVHQDDSTEIVKELHRSLFE